MKFRISNNNSTSNNHNQGSKNLKTVSLEKEWAQILSKEGVKPDLKIPVQGHVKGLTYKTIKSTKVLIKANIYVKLKQTRQRSSQNKLNVAWKKTLDIIPEMSTSINFKETMDLPKHAPPIHRIRKVLPNSPIVRARTLHNRIVIQGKSIFDINYYPQD